MSNEKNAIRAKITELESISNAKNKSLDELIRTFNESANVVRLNVNDKKAVLNRFIDKITIFKENEEELKVKIVINPNNSRLPELLDLSVSLVQNRCTLFWA